ncbi:MAG: hypothetical protein QOH34_1589, partial [Mycobacterium sp.]|nr:hypothetical protein [Mycobacterium sp.]
GLSSFCYLQLLVTHELLELIDRDQQPGRAETSTLGAGVGDVVAAVVADGAAFVTEFCCPV